MFVRLYSDLHLECANFRIPALPEDSESVLILAGDIGERGKPRHFVETACKQFKHVLYVHGNHEYFNGEYYEVKDYWRTLASQINNLHFLDNDSIIIDDVRFLGTVLWTDMMHGDWFAVQKCKSSMMEYQVVRIDDDWVPNKPRTAKPAGRLLTAMDTIDMHSKARTFLIDELSKKFEGKTVVITHHSPSMNFVESMYAESPLNGGFHANCDDLFNYDIDYWFYGHTHCATRRNEMGIQFISNPRGYVGYENQKLIGFDANMQLEL